MGICQLLQYYNNYHYNYHYPSTTTTSDFSDLAGPILAVLGVFIIIILAVAILTIIANWIIFKKMGIAGWKSLIPYVNQYLQMEKTGVDQRWLLILVFGGLICIIPFLGILLFMVVIIYFAILYLVSLAKSFGKSSGFAVGLIFLSPIFLCILAFGKDEYIGPRPMNDIIFKGNSTTLDNEVTTSKTCPKCGSTASEKSKFCTNCGTEL